MNTILDELPTSMIRVTRYTLNCACNTALMYINDENVQIHLIKCAMKHTRNTNIYLKQNHIKQLLHINKIVWFSDIIHNHWAETDGEFIYLNTTKSWSMYTLVTTLVHEVIHGFILHNSHEIPEEKEHKIMNELYISLL